MSADNTQHRGPGHAHESHEGPPPTAAPFDPTAYPPPTVQDAAQASVGSAELPVDVSALLPPTAKQVFPPATGDPVAPPASSQADHTAAESNEQNDDAPSGASSTEVLLDVAGSDRTAERPAVERLRPWLSAAAVLMLTVTFCVVYGLGIAIRTGERPRQAEAGSEVTYKSVTARVVAWEASPAVRPKEDSEPDIAEPGAVWVRVDIEVDIDQSSDELASCMFQLVLTDRSFVEGQLPSRALNEHPAFCDDSIKAAGSGLVVTYYKIPDTKLDQVAGVSFDHVMMLRPPPLLSPPEEP